MFMRAGYVWRSVPNQKTDIKPDGSNRSLESHSDPDGLSDVR